MSGHWQGRVDGRAMELRTDIGHAPLEASELSGSQADVVGVVQRDVALDGDAP